MSDVFLSTIVYYGSSGGSFFGGTGFYIAMAALLILVGIWQLYNKTYKYTKIKQVCTIPVDARIMQVDSKFGGRGGRFWNITYEFFFNERRYIVNNDIWEQTRMNRPIEGNVETIMINPYNPHELYDRLMDHGRKIGILTGVLMTIAAITIIAVPLINR